MPNFYEQTGLYQVFNGTEYVLNAAGQLVTVDELSLMEKINRYVMWITSRKVQEAASESIATTVNRVANHTSDIINTVGPILQTAADSVSSILHSDTDLSDKTSNLARPLARAGHELFHYATAVPCDSVIEDWARETLIDFPQYKQFETITITFRTGHNEERDACVREKSGSDTYQYVFHPQVYDVLARTRRALPSPTSGNLRRNRRDTAVHVPLETLLNMARPTSEPEPSPWLPGGAELYTW